MKNILPSKKLRSSVIYTRSSKMRCVVIRHLVLRPRYAKPVEIDMARATPQ
jgi:hypothetical protein